MKYIIEVRDTLTDENKEYLRKRDLWTLNINHFKFIVMDLGYEKMNYYQVEYGLEKLHELGYEHIKVQQISDPTPHKQYQAIYRRTDGYELPVGQGWMWTEEQAEKLIIKEGDYIKRIVGNKFKEFDIKERDYFTSPEPNKEYKGKPVYNRDTFEYDVAEIGDYVTTEIATDAGNAVPPIEYNSNMIQCGEPTDSRYDDRKCRYRNTYATFVRVGNDVWEYRGDCFAHETMQRGNTISVVA